MSSRIEYSVNVSTSLVLAEPFSIVYLSNSELPNPESNITIRDYTGNVGTQSSIRISTTQGVKFLDGRTQYTLTEPYGYITVNSIDSNTWSLVNSFNISTQVAQSVDLLKTTSTNISTLYTNLFSTNTILTSSIGGFAIGKPRFAIDISGIVNADNIFENEEEFTLGGDIEIIRTSSLNIATDGLNGSPSTNMLIGKTSIYTYSPNNISYDYNQIILYSNLINVNSTLNIANTGQVGINTSSFTNSLMDVSGIITTTNLSFPFPVSIQTNINPSISIDSINYSFNKWIMTFRGSDYETQYCVFTSDDGIVWDSNTGWGNSGFAYLPYKAVYNGSNALVYWSPNYTIQTTSDGSNFTQSFIPDQMRVFYAAEPNIWIGFANSGYPNYPTFSTDGYNWQGTGTITYIVFYDFTYGPNAYGSNCFAAIGNDYFTNELGIFLSYDNGSNWSSPYTAPPNLNNLYDGNAKIVYNGSYYCVLAYNQFSGNRWTAISSNLSNWTLSTQEIDPSSFNLLWLNNKWFITVPGYNKYYTSTDGLNWTERQTNLVNRINDIAYNGSNLFMAVGQGIGINYEVSSDGINWYTPSNISYSSTLIESYSPQSTLMVNTSTLAKVSYLPNEFSLNVTNISVTDTVLVGTDSNEGLLKVDKIGINNLTPNATFDILGSLNVNEKVITNNFLNEGAGGNFVSSIAVKKSSASFDFDIDKRLRVTSGYIVSSLGVNKTPSYTVDVSGILNMNQLYINGVEQTNIEYKPSSLILSTLRVTGEFSNVDYAFGVFNVNHSFFIYANNTLVTGLYFNNVLRSTDCNMFFVALSNQYPFSFEAGAYNPNINRWGFLRRTDTLGNWVSFTTQDFVNYTSSATIVSFNAFNNFQLVYGSNNFWMIGDNGNSNTSLWRSADGISWTNIVSPLQTIYTLVYTGSNFLISGFNNLSNGFFTYRTDFSTYSNVTPLQNIRVLSLDFNGSTYMGTGFYLGTGVPNAQSNVEFSSSDSVTWQTNLLPNISTREYGSFNSPTLWTGTYWARLYYDLTNGYTYAQSNSGTTVSTWSAPVLTPITQGQRVRNNFTYDGAKFWVAGGAGGGNEYTAYATNLFVSSTYISTARVLSDFPSTVFYTSTFFEGQTFTQGVNTSTIQARADNILQLESFGKVQTTSSNVFVTINNPTSAANLIKYSVDGLTWTNATINNRGTMAYGWSVAYNGRTWLTCLQANPYGTNTFFSSSDGITWNSNTSSGFFAQIQLFGVYWAANQWFALGQDGLPNPRNSNYTISRSPDGSNWTPVSSGGFFYSGVSLATNGSRLVAVGNGLTANESIKYSDDNGNTWSNISSNGFATVGTGIAWNGYMWVAAGMDSTANGSIKYSFNGINWTNISANGFSTRGIRVAWNGNMWVAVGQDSVNSIKYSFDGINWSNATGGFTSGTSPNTVVWTGSQWFAVGDTTPNTLKYSLNGINWSNITGVSDQATLGFGLNSNVFPDLQVNNISLFGKNLFNTVYSTNSIHLQTSSLLFNTAVRISQPLLTTQTLSNPTVDIIGTTRIQTLFTQSTLSIRNPNPLTLLDIQLPSTSGVFTSFPIVRGNARDSNTSTLLTSINTWASLPGLPQSNTSAYAFYSRGGTTGNSNYKAAPTSSAFFTGQHANMSIDSRITPETLSKTVGLIVSSADQGYYSILPNGNIVEGKDAIWITESLPKIKLADTDMDPGVWGIITNNKNEAFNANGTREIDYQTPFSQDLQGRIRVNGSGEGAIWVTNMNGPLENGDYICSSVIPGYGRRQNDDRLHSYTVAKATMSCDFSLNQSNYVCDEFTYNNKTYRKAFIGCSYHCS